MRRPRRRRCRGPARMSEIARDRASPGLRDHPRHPRRLAARRRPWAIDREAAIDDLVAAFDAGVDDFRLRGHLHRRRGTDRRLPHPRRGDPRRGGRARHPGPHQARARSRRAGRTIDKALYRGHRRSLASKRLRMERLDLVQFHWWSYAAPGLMEAVGWLDEFRRAGKIRHVGLTNFDTRASARILSTPASISSACRRNIPSSTRGRRTASPPYAASMASGCSVTARSPAGSSSDRWLGAPEPAAPLENRSLVKYKLIIEDFGGWELFQELLRALRRVADRHGVDIATIASRYVLDRPRAAAVIVGARNRAHVADNARVPSSRLPTPTGPRFDAVIARRDGAARRLLRARARSDRAAWLDHALQQQREEHESGGRDGESFLATTAALALAARGARRCARPIARSPSAS